MTQPFRPFFLLAALDAIIGVALWPSPGSAWHRQELLFGMVPAVLAGFLLTALPRWTGQPLASRFVTPAMLVLWLPGRVFDGPVVPLFIVVLTLIVAWHVFAAGGRRDVKVVALLVFLSAGGMIADDHGTRLALAAILGLVMVLGGRIIPALTAAYLGRDGQAFSFARREWLEAGAAWLAVVGLSTWVMAPGTKAAAIAGALAAAGQVARLVQWQFWRVLRRPELLVLHAAYSWIAVGFAGGGIHAWTTGAVGLMCLGIMASMVRRQMRMAFERSTMMSVAFAFGFVAALVRALADSLGGDRTIWLGLAAFAWIAAYLLFVVAFGRILLRLGSGSPLRRQ
ncbi:MAG: NnrS family protein [Proteobacteria bacterium]|nr:NnrS family protein [Pseudomonadota bacterium]